MSKLHHYLDTLIEQEGSDILLGVGYRPAIRRFGTLVKLEGEELSSHDLEEILDTTLKANEKEILKAEQDYDFAFQYESSKYGFRRFRGNVFFQRFGVSMVFRAINNEIPTLESLGLPDHLGPTLMEHHQGLVMVTGPSGSGKTSTLAALINYVNLHRPLNVITLEDPIEYVHKPAQSMVVQRQVGLHCDSYASALRAALREDPDVILVGELRDLETISLSITAAETGHLVLGTMNTISAGQTISRLVNSFPPNQQAQIRLMVADSLRGIISQQLVAREDGRGQVPALEVLIANNALTNLIRENKMHQLNSVMQTHSKRGMIMMDNSLRELVTKGLVSSSVAYELASDKKTFMERVGN